MGRGLIAGLLAAAIIAAAASGYLLSGTKDTEGTGPANSASANSSSVPTRTRVVTSGPNSTGNLTTYRGPNTGLPDCGSRREFFNTPPMNLSQFVGIVPLGNLNPPQHVLPTDHLYFYLRFAQSSNGLLAEKVPVVAPGNLTILQISSNNVNPTHTDYQVYFWPCSQFYGYFDHLSSRSPELQALFTPPFNRCQQYAAISNGQSCTKNVNVPVRPGHYLGTAGGVQNGSVALDFGAVDLRVAPLAYAVPGHYSSFQLQKVCAIDYYTPSVADVLRTRLGSFDWRVHRTAAPLCGSINQDIPGTAQGNWFGKSMAFPVTFESQAIALVHDNVNVSQGVFSIGSSTAGVGFRQGAYRFSPASTGLVNLDFQYVKPGQVYCYEAAPYYSAGSYARTVILIQLLDSLTLRIEALTSGSTSSCGAGPWTLTANYTDFQR